MKVIQNGTGWDIAFDMVFTDKATAAIIARRIAPLLSTLVRDAVDASMCGHPVVPQHTRQDRRDDVSAAPEAEDQALHPPLRVKQKRPVDVAPAVYAMPSIASRVLAMGL